MTGVPVRVREFGHVPENGPRAGTSETSEVVGGEEGTPREHVSGEYGPETQGRDLTKGWRGTLDTVGEGPRRAGREV